MNDSIKEVMAAVGSFALLCSILMVAGWWDQKRRKREEQLFREARHAWLFKYFYDEAETVWPRVYSNKRPAQAFDIEVPAPQPAGVGIHGTFQNLSEDPAYRFMAAAVIFVIACFFLAFGIPFCIPYAHYDHHE